MLFYFSIVLISRLIPFRVKRFLMSLTLITKSPIISLNWYREEIEMDYMNELAAIAQEHGSIFLFMNKNLLLQ